MKNRGNKSSNAASSGTGQPAPTLVERPASIDNGEAERGTVTARENQTSTQSEPDAATLAMAGNEEMAAKVVALRTNAQNDYFATIRAEKGEKLAEKMTLLGESRQRLAEAADMLATGQASEKEAGNILATVGANLYRLRIGGQLSNDELTSLLGDTFGFRKKGKGGSTVRVPAGHPDASKTPYGQGNNLRNRLTRAVQGHAYVADTANASAFFDGLDAEAVDAELKRLETGKASLYTVFDALSALKKQAKAPAVDAAFNPLNVAKFVSAYSGKSAVDIIAANPDLASVCAELRDVLTVVSQELASRMAKAA
jgi:hypothetical protein